MTSGSFVIVIDIPSIKKYVFGTDPLNEVRGASALLDRLNQVEMKQRLHKHLGCGACGIDLRQWWLGAIFST